MLKIKQVIFFVGCVAMCQGIVWADPPANYEGFGAVTNGALDAPGGYEVYHVTTLADSPMYTPGTLRYAVFREAGQTKGQYIVFDVAGTIKLGTEYRLKTGHSYTTIDGSTAPSPGITFDTVNGAAIYGFNVEPSSTGPAHDIIVNNVRFLGPGHNESSDDILGINGTDNSVYNVIYSNCTIHGAGDGVFDITGDVSNVTISWNFITDTTNASAISGDSGDVDEISFHHNVWAECSERMAKIKSHSEYIDFVNNVVYGWGWIEGSGKGLQLEPFDSWRTGVTYGVDNYILYDGTVYKCIVYHTSATGGGDGGGGEPDTNPTQWDSTALVPNDWPRVNIQSNKYHWVDTYGEVPYWGLIRYNARKEWCTGLLYFNDNDIDDVLPDLVYGAHPYLETTNTSAQHDVSPYGVTTYAVGTLGDTVVPYVGTQYPTSGEQQLLNDISIAIGSSWDPNNPPPVLQAIGDKSVDENVTLTFDVNATDPNGEPITYSARYLPTGANFAGETFSWTPSYSQAGSYQVRFIASDDNSQDSETITITVNNVNRPPVLGSIADQSVNETALLSFSVNATDPDGQTLTYSVSGLPNGAVFASQTLTWTPSYDQAGTFAVTFTADDGQAQDSQVVTITVINVNRAPVFTAINNKSVWSDDPLTFTVNATDPDGDMVTYSANTVPSGATFITQTFDWTPTPAQIGTYDVTFYASDGQLQDSEAITITVNVDSLAPTVTNLSPSAGAIQVPLNNLITLNVTDAGKGIEPQSVKIKVRINSNPNNDTVYFGDIDHYISLLGDCRRIGNNADYKLVFQPTQDLFYNDQTVTITVNATDLAGNIMNPYIYSFVTEMHLFGQNKLVNTNLDNNDRPVTVCDSSGNIWAAWHTGSADSRDIYIGTLASGADNFGSTIQLTNDATDQCNPALALDSNDKLYAVWQDNRKGDWDIYISTSVDGINWSTETRVNDPNNGNQVNPAIVIDGQSPSYAHVVWQDDRAGNQDICVATSNDGFTTKTISQITSDTSDQVDPAVVADSTNTIYVVWTDSRNGSSDIYGAASNNGPWTNVAIVSNVNNQSSPVIAAESTGSILHFLWVDDTPGDNDIYYASSNNGLPDSPLTGSSIIDGTSGADQLEPTIAITGTTSDEDLKVFACWQDWRNTDTDLYFTELSAGSGTNVFVNDGGSSAYQSEPVIGIDEYGYPYLIWADNRSTNTDIYYTGSTFIEPVALASALVTASAPSSTIIGVDPQSITNIDDVSIVLPVGACSYDVDISIVAILNQQVFSSPCLGSYDFGPSGIQFNQPVTITIPYAYANSNGSTVPYWFNSLTGTLSQQGITNVQDIVISPTLHAVSFQTMHFTPFYLLGGDATVALGGGGGGGGCSVSAGDEGNIVEFILPYVALALFMLILKWRDRRYRKDIEETLYVENE